jgi:hypothetical protein
MSQLKEYSPEYGQKYQILVMCPNDREYEYCDYAKDKEEKKHLLDNYKQAYGIGFSFKTIVLPQKYWNEKTV